MNKIRRCGVRCVEQSADKVCALTLTVPNKGDCMSDKMRVRGGRLYFNLQNMWLEESVMETYFPDELKMFFRGV